MKIKIIILFLLVQSVGHAQQSWQPLGDDDFNRASCGKVMLAGSNPIVIKNKHIFLFNTELADYGSNNSHFSISKYNGSQWEHIDFPFLFTSIPTIDCAVDNNEIPYVLLNDESQSNLPVVKKYENGNWVDVGTGISNLTAGFLNIAIGTDNLPQILFREGNIIKLKKFDGTNWVEISKTTEFIPYTSISLKLDKNNIPYVLSNYQVGTTYNCFVKKFNGSAWEEVGITGFTDKGDSLLFDNLNVPHMTVGNVIKKFNGSSWENISTPLAFFNFGIGTIFNLFFNDSNDLYASFYGTPYRNPTNVYVAKLVGTKWEKIVTNAFLYDHVYSVYGNDVYFVDFGTDNYPDVVKIVNGQSVLLGGSTFMSRGIHDFSICNGVPLVSYKGNGDKASIRAFVNDNWADWGQISENAVSRTIIKSGTDGNIYLAYNNIISSYSSDTKLTVKKLSTTGWQTVGPVNFSLSAGNQFDFKISHANQPYVLYMSGRVQKFDGTNWVFVGGSAFTGDAPARLALDTNDVPYIAYEDWSNSGHIAVKKLNGNVWEYVNPEGLAEYSDQNYRPRIVIDTENNIYLGFTDNTLKVHIKKLNNGVWESVGSDFFTSASTDQYEMAVDHNNVLHVVYNELENSFRTEAKVKKFNGTDWEFVGEPNFSPTSIVTAKIDFMKDNTPIVSYSNQIGSNYNINTRFFGESNALSVNEPQLVFDNQKWILAPNPVISTFSFSGNDEIQSLEIYDITGKKVLSENRNFKNINVSSLHSGIYIVKVKTESGTSSVKLIKD